jgi:protein involved in polysaccharide export with SLBB domain
LTEISEFESFAESATGRYLPVFGRQLFDQVPTTFAPLEHIPVPADYVLGPGDELLIRAWGKIDLDARVTVDRNGQIYLPKIGMLHVAGLRSQQLEGFLHAEIGTLFKDFDLDVSLGQLRSIQILVLGNARQPGAYTIGSLSTLVNAIFASGGPSATGTMRRIQLLRSKRLITEFDLYDLAQLGDLSHDVQLLPGDVIYIPPIGAQIAISGDITIPGLYELKGQTTLSAALGVAGGLTNLADNARVSLERLDNHRSRRLEEFPLDQPALERPMADGDLLRIFPLSPKFQNAVTLRGNVAQPGRYLWTAGMRISELLPTRDLLITRTYWNRQNQLVPGSTSNPFGKAKVSPGFGTTHQRNGTEADLSADIAPDRNINGLSNSESIDQTEDGVLDDPFRTNNSQSRKGPQSASSLDQPDGAKNPPDSMIASIGQNSTEVNWEYAVIERLDEHDLSTRLIPFCLSRAIDDPHSVDNQPLLAGDVVTIFSRADLELPIEKRASFVRVGGEVNAPGMYRVIPGESLREVVRQAGGLTSHSYLYATFFTRLSTRLVEQEQLRQSTEQMQRELVSRYANATPAAGQTGMDQQAQLAMEQAALAELASTKPTGRVVLEMRADATSLDDIPDLPLEDGDILYIPPRLSTVQVTGAVYNANAFRHQPGRPLITYLDAAGGVTREADQKRTFVIRADGTVVSRQSRISSIHGGFEHLVLLPGDAIVVPAKLKVSSKIDSLLQATQFMSQTALTAASLSVIK